MKRIMTRLAALAALAAVLLTGCVGVNFQTGRYVGSVRDNGERTVVDYEVDSFDSVRVEGDFVMRYEESASCAASVSVPESLAQYVKVRVDDGVLIASSDDGIRFSGQNSAPILTVSAPEIKLLDVYGAVTMDESDTLHGGSLEINVAGAGALELSVDVEDLKITVAGASAITMDGTADTADISIAGASSIEALDVDTKTASVSLDGTGFCSISCSEELNADISGMGAIEYRGDATVHPNISGFGTVSKVN